MISNCVISLSTDKPAVLTAVHRVLAPGGRVEASEAVDEDDVTPRTTRRARLLYRLHRRRTDRTEYLDDFSAAGFVKPSVWFVCTETAGLSGCVTSGLGREAEFGVGWFPRALGTCIPTQGRAPVLESLWLRAQRRSGPMCPDAWGRLALSVLVGLRCSWFG